MMYGSRLLSNPHTNVQGPYSNPCVVEPLAWSKIFPTRILNARDKRFSGCAAARSLRVVYSHSSKQVPVKELAMLLQSEWGALLPEDRLRVAVLNSTATVAAYAREESLMSDASEAQKFHKPSRIILIGFARASTDRAFAGTIHNLIVHPLARRQGIGTTILSRITRQLKLGGVTDIGMNAPPSSISFLLKASFDSDRELTTPMHYGNSELALGRIVP